MQELQKQRLLQPDSPRSPSSQRPQQMQPLSLPSSSPKQAQQAHQQLQSQSSQQASDQSDDDWTWPQPTTLSRNQQATDRSSQPPGGSQLAQNGPQSAAQHLSRPQSASASSPVPQDIDGSQLSPTTSRSRTGTASPRTTNDALISMASKNVSCVWLLACHFVTHLWYLPWQMAQRFKQNSSAKGDICMLSCILYQHD